jgi:hypothetical protein
MFAAELSVDLARLLLDLLIVLVAAKLAAEVAEHLRVPAVLGEIAAGIVIGPSVLGLIDLGDQRGISLAVLAEIGVLLLLLSVGMEMDLGELGKVGAASIRRDVGVVVLLAAGGGAIAPGTATPPCSSAPHSPHQRGITAGVRRPALLATVRRIVLGAVADDVLGPSSSPSS